MKKKKIFIFLIITVIALGTMFKDELIQTYMAASHTSLERYSEELLESSHMKSASYGLWDVNICHEDQMVEFMTGGFGLVPSSTYKGFYYSSDNTHHPFSAADASIASLEMNGDHAAWTDGTDNHGTSVRIIDKWFWFEASF